MSKAWPILFFAALLFVVAVVTVVLTRPERKVVHDRPVITTPIVSSPITPLPRDSGPRNNASRAARAKTGRPTSAISAPSTTRRGVSAPARNRPHPKTVTPKKRPKAPTRPSSPSAPQPSPAQPRPLVGVTVPAPVSACVDRLAGLNCP